MGQIGVEGSLGQLPDFPSGSGEALAQHRQRCVLLRPPGGSQLEFLETRADRGKDDAIAPCDEPIGAAATAAVSVRAIHETDQSKGLGLIKQLLNLSNRHPKLLRQQVVGRPNDREPTALPVLRLGPREEQIDHGYDAERDIHIGRRALKGSERAGRCNAGIQATKLCHELRRLGGMFVEAA